MSYYGQGDYYGQGGLWDVFKKGVGVLTRGVGAVVNPVGAATTMLGGGQGPTSLPVIRTPGVAGGFQRLIPGGKTGYQVDASGMPVRRRRRRINPANAKALNRANRRVDAFVRMAKRSLKHTNYKLVSKSAGRSKRRPQVLVETGSGSINAR